MANRKRVRLLPQKDQPKSKPAVNTLLNDELQEQICQLTELGDPPDCICDYLGISSFAFMDWIRKGKSYIEGGNEPEQYEIYGMFYQAYRKSWAIYRQTLRRSLHESSSKAWIKWCTILERRDRKNYGRRDYPASNVSSIDPQETFL